MHTANETLDTAFQFHKGTIKPKPKRQKKIIPNLFQFHKGTIKPLGNSISRAVDTFQFHKGTIKPH